MHTRTNVHVHAAAYHPHTKPISLHMCNNNKNQTVSAGNRARCLVCMPCHSNSPGDRPSNQYRAKVARGLIDSDPNQLGVVAKLDRCPCSARTDIRDHRALAHTLAFLFLFTQAMVVSSALQARTTQLCGLSCRQQPLCCNR